MSRDGSTPGDWSCIVDVVIVVEGFRASPEAELDIRDEVWPMALDQRAWWDLG